MRDGLYAIVAERFVAGFTIKNGKVDLCAPILRRRLASDFGHWFAQARYLGS